MGCTTGGKVWAASTRASTRTGAAPRRTRSWQAASTMAEKKKGRKKKRIDEKVAAKLQAKLKAACPRAARCVRGAAGVEGPARA